MGSASSPRTGLGCAPPGLMDEFSSSPSWERLLAVGPGASAFYFSAKVLTMAHLGGTSVIGCQSQKHPSHEPIVTFCLTKENMNVKVLC